MQDVVILQPKKIEELKKSISREGIENLHILSDFDRTLTKAFVDGKNIPSLISILRDNNYLGSGYAQEAHELYNKYHSIEINPRISLEEKKKAMHEWWTTHFNLLIKSGLNKNDLKKAVKSRKIRFRSGFAEFVDLLQRHSIPLVIMSSSGLGGDAISMYLREEGRLYDNIYIISNSYEWDENGNAAAVKQPIIHAMNKDKAVIQDFPVFNVIKDRKNVLLLGDSLADIGMIEGFDYDNLVKIGFLNENVKENLKEYKNSYDVIILNDSSMDYVNDLLKKMLK